MGGRGAKAGNTTKLKSLKLEGTEKQIKWAEDIRKEALNVYKIEAEVFKTKQFKEDYLRWKKEGREDLYSIYDKYQSEIVNQTSASTYILRRDWIGKISEYEKDRLKKIKNQRSILAISYLKNRYGL